MRKLLTRLVPTAVAAGLAIVVVAPAASAQQYPVTVTGEAPCVNVSGGGYGQFLVDWTVTNGGGLSLAIESATESGAASGNVTIDPDPIPATESGTGAGTTISGTQMGNPLTLTVEWIAGGGGTSPGTPGTSTVTITLQTCLFPPPDPGPSPATSSTSSSSTTSTSTSTGSGNAAAANAAVVTPRFTG